MSEKKMNEKEKEIMWWECPECGWCPSDITDMDSPELFYYVENNKAIPIKEGWIEVRNENKGSLTYTFKMNLELLKEIMKTKNTGIYPRRINGSSCYDYWSGASGCSWDEIHKCPNCNEEFEFGNSTI
ncbi:hypothetical protein ES707_02311 [subsurface metagenome]|jgi:hypothetical protein